MEKEIQKKVLISEKELTELKSSIDEIKEMLGKKTQEKRWIRTSEMRQRYGLAESTLHSLRQKGVVKTNKLGGTVFYDVKSVEDYLNGKGE